MVLPEYLVEFQYDLAPTSVKLAKAMALEGGGAGASLEPTLSTTTTQVREVAMVRDAARQ